jgi:hypothetical protein
MTALTASEANLVKRCGMYVIAELPGLMAEAGLAGECGRLSFRLFLITISLRRVVFSYFFIYNALPQVSKLFLYERVP